MTPETSYMEDSLSIDQNVCVLAGGGGAGFGMIQVHYIYCAPYYISSTSVNQALDSRIWGPLL